MSSYAFKTTPWRHQRRALKFLLRQGWGGALLMEPRTGKTKTTVDWLNILTQQGKITRAVIVCPNRVIGTWVTELMAHSPRRVHVSVWDRAGRQAPDLRGYPWADLQVLVINYEAFATPGKRLASGRRSRASGRDRTRRMIDKWRAGYPTALVLDEMHKIKSASGKASNMLVTMARDYPFRVGLTGTPLTKANKTHDIYMQWKFINPRRFADVPTLAEFKSRYGRWLKKDGYDKYLGPRNLSELHERMQADSFVVRRDECFDLPPREDIVEYVDLSPATRSAYDQMAKQMVALLESGATAEASLKIVQSLRLSQITSGFVTDDEGTIQRLGFEKLERLSELLQERWDQEQPMVVAARWRADLDLIEDLGRTARVPTFAIRGRVKREDSDRAIEEFRKAEGAALMVVQPAAASLGIDLSSASHMVWYSHTPRWVDFSQCCDRIALSRTSTTFTHLVARHTVDEVLLDTLAGDGDLARAIMSRPGELLNGHPLNLDDHSRLKGIGSFQYRPARGKA